MLISVYQKKTLKNKCLGNEKKRKSKKKIISQIC